MRRSPEFWMKKIRTRHNKEIGKERSDEREIDLLSLLFHIVSVRQLVSLLPYGPIVFLVDVKVIEAESKERRESKKVNITDPLTFV